MENKIDCYYCKGKAILKQRDLKLFEGKIVLKQQPYYQCLKCRRDFATSEQMLETEKELNTFSVKRQIVETGRSLAITIPKEMAEFFELKKGSEIQLIPESKSILKIRIC